MSPNATTSRSPLRKDARENLAKITTAAVDVFQRSGLGAPLEEIAKRAGVSIGTLYNRFASRELLIDAVVDELAAARLEQAIHAADAEVSPWSRFETYVWSLCELQADCPALSDLFARKYPNAEKLVAICERTLDVGAHLIADAQREGSLRSDFAAHDLFLLLIANAAVITAGSADDTAAWRRGVGFVLDGIHSTYEVAISD
jgi:AcrR family transcriptional regulator